MNNTEQEGTGVSREPHSDKMELRPGTHCVQGIANDMINPFEIG